MVYTLETKTVLKLVIVFIILITPLFKSQLKPFDNIIFKVVFLLILIGLSVVDLQISILLLIWFILVLIINNYGIITNKKEERIIKEERIPPRDIENDIEQPLIENKGDLKQKVIKKVRFNDTPVFYDPPSSLSSSSSEASIKEYRIPSPYCPSIDNNMLNESSLEFSLDEKTKPYEQYIKMLSSEESFRIIQNNEIGNM